MCLIMDEVHSFVPSNSAESQQVLDNGETESIVAENFHQILFGGDQLTVARCRGSIAARCDDDTMKGRLHGLVPVSEDWHAKYRLCKVSVCV